MTTLSLDCRDGVCAGCLGCEHSCHADAAWDAYSTALAAGMSMECWDETHELCDGCTCWHHAQAPVCPACQDTDHRACAGALCHCATPQHLSQRGEGA